MKSLQESGNFNRFNRYDPDDDQPTKIESKPLIHKSTSSTGISRLAQFCLCLLPIIFFLVCLICLAVILGLQQSHNPVQQDQAFRSLTYLEQLLSTAPIKEITTVKITSAASTCPQGYETAQIGYHPGLRSGCLCSNDKTVHSRLYCSVHSKCHYKAGYSSKFNYVWRLHYICVKRFAVGEWKSHLPCPSGWKQCHDVCVNGNVCPISQITLMASTYTSSVQTVISFLFVKAIISRSTARPALVRFESMVSYQPCLDIRGLRPVTKSETYYPLDRVKSTGCQTFQSLTNTELLDENYDRILFLRENVGNAELKTWPFVTQYINSQDKNNIYSVKRPQVKNTATCRTLNMQKIQNLRQGSEKFDDAVVGFGITGLIISIIGFLLCLIVILFWALRKAGFFASNKIIWIINIIGLILAIILIIFGIYNMSIHSEYEVSDSLKHYDLIIKNKCFTNSNYEKAIKFIRDFVQVTYQEIGPIAVFLFVWSLIYLILLLIFTVIHSVKKEHGSLLCDPIRR